MGDTRRDAAARTRQRLLRALAGGNPDSNRLQRIKRLVQPARLYLFMMPNKPAGGRYAYGRGSTVDRRYIETFLSNNRELIRGRCLEVGDSRYTNHFGGSHVQSLDVLDIDPTNDKATILGDLQDLRMVEDESYDCVIVTQVLQYLRDPSAGVREIRRILAPGGSALVTVPTMAPVDPESDDVQRFMPLGVQNLFAAQFDSSSTVVRCYGNLLTGLAYWAGLAQEDLPKRAWSDDDAVYPVVITVLASVAPVQ